MAKKRILFIEDEPFYQRMYGDVLTQAGYEITFAAEGKEALVLFSKDSFVAVIVDLIMPIMSGISFLKKLRQVKRKIRPVLLVLTTLEGASDRQDSMNAGADGFYSKSETSPQKLLRVIQQLGSNERSAETT
ncbi:MAG: response regulator [bacterium]|nr:response regulator [bacterium]